MKKLNNVKLFFLNVFFASLTSIPLLFLGQESLIYQYFSLHVLMLAIFVNFVLMGVKTKLDQFKYPDSILPFIMFAFYGMNVVVGTFLIERSHCSSALFFGILVLISVMIIFPDRAAGRDEHRFTRIVNGKR